MRRLRRTALVVLLLVAGALAAAAWYDQPQLRPGSWLGSAGLEARYETIASRRLRFVRVGTGSAVVLIHGFGSSIYTWKDVIPLLAARHDVVALDLPGFGESDRPADLSLEDFPVSVIGLMDRLGIARAALVGNSMGGAAAAVVAGTRPERVSGLVLLDAAGFNTQPEARPGMVRLATSWAAPVLGLLPGKRLVVERSLREVFHDDTLVTAERVAEALPAITAPTLVVWGDDDRWIPIAHADRFVAAISGARKVVIPACGHVPQEEKPAEVARLVLELLD